MEDKVWQEGLYRYLVSYIARQILLLSNIKIRFENWYNDKRN